jgi:hypothetical protein
MRSMRASNDSLWPTRIAVRRHIPVNCCNASASGIPSAIARSVVMPVNCARSSEIVQPLGLISTSIVAMVLPLRSSHNSATSCVTCGCDGSSDGRFHCGNPFVSVS